MSSQIHGERGAPRGKPHRHSPTGSRSALIQLPWGIVGEAVTTETELASAGRKLSPTAPRDRGTGAGQVKRCPHPRCRGMQEADEDGNPG